MNRRDVLKFGLASIGTAWIAHSARARAVALCKEPLTPPQTSGPFYPVVDQVDKDSDLVQVAGRPAPAKGRVILVQGTVTDQFCKPVEGALVEIWQACESGRYNHPADTNPAPLDPNFQGWGKALTDENGFYRFRTVFPGAYPAEEDWTRPPHIHFKVSRLGYHELITQMYFEGERLNGKDRILQDLSKEQQKHVVVRLASQEKLPHPAATFPIRIRKAA